MSLLFIVAFIFIVILIFKVVFINITINVNINMCTNLVIVCQEKKERGMQEEGTPFLVSSCPRKKKGRRT